MKTLTPIGDKVIGKMVDGFGLQKTDGGLIVNEADGQETSIRPRWFEVTHVGPEQDSVREGEYVLMAHGRWSRGLDFYNTGRKEDFIFRLDPDDMLAVSDTPPTRITA